MQENVETCPNCTMPNKGKHWSENLCYSALQQRIKEQHEKMLQLVQHISYSQQSDVRHSCSVMNFQFGKLDLAVKTGNIEQAANAAKALTRAGITVLSYLGYWDVEVTQEKLDKEVAGGLTKGG